MFTLPGNIKVLNLPEQVEKNTKDIVGLNQKDKLTDNALASFNIILNSQIEKVSKLENDMQKNAEDIADLNQKSEYADTNIVNLQSQTASNAAKISTLETNTTSPDGNITTGTLDVKNNATFGKVIVNSVDDITDKDGNAIVKNESLDVILYDLMKGRFSNTHLYAVRTEQTYYVLPVLKGVSLGRTSDWSGCYSGSTFIKPVDAPDGGAISLPNFHNSKPYIADIVGNATWGPQTKNGYLIVQSDFLGFHAFQDCPNLTHFYTLGNPVKVFGDAESIFEYDFNLESIEGLDFSNVNGLSHAFLHCSKLKSINCSHFKVSFDISESTAFETADLVEIISNLDPVTTPQTLTIGATNLAKLTQDQILVATGRGWTLA